MAFVLVACRALCRRAWDRAGRRRRKLARLCRVATLGTKLYLINNAYLLIALLIMGAILAVQP
jgi:hypothetical protein